MHVTQKHKAVGSGADLALMIVGVLMWVAGCIGLMVVLAQDRASDTAIAPESAMQLAQAPIDVPSSSMLHDEAFGVALNARALRRIVQVLQWREVASVPMGLGDEVLRDEGAYQLVWSERLIDSARFAQPETHVNPPTPPYGSIGFGPAELLGVDADAQSGWVSVTADAVRLPDNLAAVFRVAGSWLVTTPESDLPQAGDLRVRFEILPPLAASPSASPEPSVVVGAEAEQDFSRQALSWIARAAGFLLTVVGAGLALQGAARRSHPQHWLARVPGMGVLAISAWLAVLAVLLAMAAVRWL